MDDKNNDTNNQMDNELLKHIQEEEAKNKQVVDEDVEINNQEVITSDRTTELSFFDFPTDNFPCGAYYPTGSVICIRPAQVREVQAYSASDENNTFDVVNRMNDIIQSCVRLKLPDGTIKTYLDIKDQDRIAILFTLRDLTFQARNRLSYYVSCDCGNEVEMEIKRENFVFYEMDEDLVKYFNNSSKTFQFNLKNGKTFELCPPNIGIEKVFADYVLKEHNEGRKPNMSYLKIVPYLLKGRNTITYDGIRAKLKEFESLDMMSYQFLMGAVDKMKMGIKELRTICPQCGAEVRTEMQIPNGFSNLFTISDAFTRYSQD